MDIPQYHNLIIKTFDMFIKRYFKIVQYVKTIIIYTYIKGSCVYVYVRRKLRKKQTINDKVYIYSWAVLAQSVERSARNQKAPASIPALANSAYE